MSANIENIKIASNSIEANKQADALASKKEISKKASKKAGVNEKQESKQAQADAKQADASKAILEKIEQSDLSINKWGDLFFSIAHNQIAKNAEFQMKSEANIFFEIEQANKQVAFREAAAADQISENSFFCFYKLRCLNRFYFKKDAQAKLEKAFSKKAQDLKLSIEFSKQKSGLLKIQ